MYYAFVYSTCTFFYIMFISLFVQLLFTSAKTVISYYLQSIRRQLSFLPITDMNWSIMPQGMPAKSCSAFWQARALSVGLKIYIIGNCQDFHKLIATFYPNRQEEEFSHKFMQWLYLVTRKHAKNRISSKFSKTKIVCFEQEYTPTGL